MRRMTALGFVALAMGACTADVVAPPAQDDAALAVIGATVAPDGCVLSPGVTVQGSWIRGTGGDDVIDCRHATVDLRIEAGAGNDRVLTGSGDDFVDAGAGYDFVHSGAGADQLVGGAGPDGLYAGTLRPPCPGISRSTTSWSADFSEAWVPASSASITRE